MSQTETVTYRGRTLEEVLPKIREELGPDAVIERQRTGLIGGVGGFFQREMVEVDARPALPGEHLGGPRPGSLDVVAGADDEDDVRAATRGADAALDEGLSAPAMRRIARQSEPFAELLADAEADLPPSPEPVAPEPEIAPLEDEDEHDWDAWGEELAGPTPPPPARPAPTPGGAHATAAYRGDTPVTPATPAPAPAPRPVAAEAAPTLAPAPAPARELPAGAAQLEAKLARSGLSAELTGTLVAEAVSHVQPFAPATRGGLKRQVRATLARRIPVQSGFGAGGRTIALVGPAGSGKTRAAAGLAAGYAAGSKLDVVCVSLRPRDVGAELAELLDPHGVTVRPLDDGLAVRTHVGARAGDAVVVIDTPAISPRDTDAIAALAGELAAAGVTETHIVLPATIAGPVAEAELAAFAPLAPTAILLTRADETDHLGPLVDLAIAHGMPLSYVSGGPDVASGLLLADPAALAARLLP